MKTFKQFIKENSLLPDLEQQFSDARRSDRQSMLRKAEHVMNVPPEQYATTTLRGGHRVSPVGDVSPSTENGAISRDAQNSNNPSYDHYAPDLKDPLYHAAVKSKVAEVRKQQSQQGRTQAQNDLEQLAMNPSGANTPKPWSGKYQEMKGRYEEQEAQAQKNSGNLG